MSDARDRRVAWIINHTTLREFEVPLMRALGLEVFTSKIPCMRGGFRSASCDYSFDGDLTIPRSDLELLNNHNFYDDKLTPAVAAALNRHFGTVMTSPIGWSAYEFVCHFTGRVIIRAFGHLGQETYTGNLRKVYGDGFCRQMKEIGERFWLGVGYETIPEAEGDFLRNRSVLLPLGIPGDIMSCEDTWEGNDERVMFVCPDILQIPYYYGKIYRRFRKYLGRLPYAVIGRQTMLVGDKNVIGFVEDPVFHEYLRSMRVMFYHSQERRHLHYHPLEAVVFGMPVIFMKGGLLEYYGGDQPGACSDYKEAKRKLRRVLGGDQDFIEEVRAKQTKMLRPFGWDYNLETWRQNFLGKVLSSPLPADGAAPSSPEPKRVALLMPPGPSRSVVAIARQIVSNAAAAARRKGKRLDIAVAVCAEDDLSGMREMLGSARDASLRTIRWEIIRTAEAQRIVGADDGGNWYSVPHAPEYLIPRDGCKDLLDCDAWMVLGLHWLTKPLLPIRPYTVFLPGYTPRVAMKDAVLQELTIANLQGASSVCVMTNQEIDQAICFAGVKRESLHKVDFLPELPGGSESGGPLEEPYLVWLIHPHHLESYEAVVSALAGYYAGCGDRLKTVVFVDDRAQACTVGKPESPWSSEIQRTLDGSDDLADNVRVCGCLHGAQYRSALARAEAALISALDGGCKLAISDAGRLGVPLLLCELPSTREFVSDRGFAATFFDPSSPGKLVEALDGLTTAPKAAPKQRRYVKNQREHDTAFFDELVLSWMP